MNSILEEPYIIWYIISFLNNVTKYFKITFVITGTQTFFYPL